MIESTGITRRAVLLGGGLGLAASGLAAGPGGPTRPLGPARAAIVLAMVGGASPWETFDPRPDAPDRLRGPFGSIASAVPGVRLGEHLPEVARRMRRLTLVRSVYHDADPTHEAGLRALATGWAGPGGTDLGALLARTLGPRGGVPPFVVLPNLVGDVGAVRSADSPGDDASLPGPFVVGVSPGSPRFDPARLLDRARRWVDRAADRGLIAAGGPAAGPAPGWDWDAEPTRVRAAFGASSFGRDCWLAGRLVESGARLVVVNMAPTVFGRSSWDAHGKRPFGTFDDLARGPLPAFDRGFAALIDDLDGRGLLGSTLVAAVGEFGRTPWVNESGGRDHWPGVWSALLAGGGTPGGLVLGASDLDGRPRDRPVPLAELVAAIGAAAGLDPGAIGRDAPTPPLPELVGRA